MKRNEKVDPRRPVIPVGLPRGGAVITGFERQRCFIRRFYHRRFAGRIFQALDPILSSLSDNSLNWHKFFEIVSRSSYDSWQVEGIGLLFLLFCWITAGVHAYLAGQRIDKIEDSERDA